MMKATIGEAIGIDGSSDEVDLLQRRIDTLNAKMLNMVTESVKSGADIESNEDEFKSISEEIEQLKSRIKAIQGCLACNQCACALYVIATESRMASRASVHVSSA